MKEQMKPRDFEVSVQPELQASEVRYMSSEKALEIAARIAVEDAELLRLLAE
jgi:hypothetical protein